SERMALASRIAEEDRNPSALYGAEKAIAEVRGIIVKNGNPNPNNIDFTTAKSMQDIGRKLLQSVGFTVTREPVGIGACRVEVARSTAASSISAARTLATANSPAR